MGEYEASDSEAQAILVIWDRYAPRKKTAPVALGKCRNALSKTKARGHWDLQQNVLMWWRWIELLHKQKKGKESDQPCRAHPLPASSLHIHHSTRGPSTPCREISVIKKGGESPNYSFQASVHTVLCQIKVLFLSERFTYINQATVWKSLALSS